LAIRGSKFETRPVWRDAIFTKKLSTHNPTHSTPCLARFSTTYATLGSPRSFVSCKTYHRAAVTAEVASSSLVVPAIFLKTYSLAAAYSGCT
jgi:hypothetical protein